MQKEKLSALMDGEVLDNKTISALSEDTTLQKSWESYHLIRDTLRADVGKVVYFDIAARVAAAIEQEPSRKVTPLIQQAQPHPKRWGILALSKKVRPWVGQIAQVSIAACVSLAVITGVQHYNQPQQNGGQNSEPPVFNTLPIMGNASPASLGAPVESVNVNDANVSQDEKEQRKRVNALWQDYELQRRLYSQPFELEQHALQQEAVQVPDNSSPSIQQK